MRCEAEDLVPVEVVQPVDVLQQEVDLRWLGELGDVPVRDPRYTCCSPLQPYRVSIRMSTPCRGLRPVRRGAVRRGAALRCAIL